MTTISTYKNRINDTVRPLAKNIIASKASIIVDKISAFLGDRNIKLDYKNQNIVKVTMGDLGQVELNISDNTHGNNTLEDMCHNNESFNKNEYNDFIRSLRNEHPDIFNTSNLKTVNYMDGARALAKLIGVYMNLSDHIQKPSLFMEVENVQNSSTGAVANKKAEVAGITLQKGKVFDELGDKLESFANTLEVSFKELTKSRVSCAVGSLLDGIVKHIKQHKSITASELYSICESSPYNRWIPEELWDKPRALLEFLVAPEFYIPSNSGIMTIHGNSTGQQKSRKIILYFSPVLSETERKEINKILFESDHFRLSMELRELIKKCWPGESTCDLVFDQQSPVTIKLLQLAALNKVIKPELLTNPAQVWHDLEDLSDFKNQQH